MTEYIMFPPAILSVVTVEFTTDMYPVPEDGGTVTVCLTSSAGTSDPLVVMVTASVKTSGDAACEFNGSDV